MHWSIASYGGVFVEVLRNRKAQEDRELQDEFGLEAVEVAELEEAQASHSNVSK